MPLAQVEFFSETLSLSSSLAAVIPQRGAAIGAAGPSAGGPPWPVLYLLHGATDNHMSWLRYSSIERYAQEKGIAVLMPSVHLSFYSDQKQGLDYFTFLSEELPAVAGAMFRLSDRREDTFAAGLSMGGYGAFKLGIRCPQRFAAVASLSGSLSQRTRLTGESPIANEAMLRMAKLTFGSAEAYDGSPDDLAHVLEGHLAAGTELPRFYQGCGTADFNYGLNLDFRRQFEGRIGLTYVETPGAGHEWSYWDAAIRDVLDWLPLRGGEAEDQREADGKGQGG
ncbi:alpha/beta hydrolase [Paenibacillus sp. B01]|uniref:alpha/beta hydrolase n=1 Tax=Paenibacillus sp. B01 TaxID=2660554 RepID=UPI00129B54FF|nr:alpha/beta hydrolase family protein [Paenibacillus sp. B01]QGG55105.1 esterase family protein [Paenibacillus sp. B01]